MTDRERIAKELYEFSGRYGGLQGRSWGFAGEMTKEEYYKEADFLLDEILPSLGYTCQPEPVLTRISDEELNGMKLLLNFGSHHKDDVDKLLNAQLAHTKKELGIR